MVGWRRRLAGGVLVWAGVVVPAGWAAADAVDVSPSTGGVGGAGLGGRVLGWVVVGGLWLSLAAVVLGAGGWWLSTSTGSYSGASRGKQFVIGGAIGALVI